jgi:hypothetical protein
MTAVVYRGPERGIKLGDEDLMMLARAFIGEAGKHLSRKEASSLFWCWMDRLLLMNAMWSREGWPFWKLVEQHSIPVKPSTLDPSGAWCQKHPKDCTSSQINRRRWIQSLTQEQLVNLGSWGFALEAQAGTLERVIPKPTYDFASCKRVKGVNVGGNCFQTYEYLSSSKKKQVIPGEVEIDMPAKEVAGYGGKLLLALIMGYGLYRAGEYLYEKVTTKK